jgi:hypothetical protein
MTAVFDVIRSFVATEPIGGRERRFEPGDIVTYDSGQTGPTITIEADMSLFLVDRSTFKTCCEFKNEPGSAYGP